MPLRDGSGPLKPEAGFEDGKRGCKNGTGGECVCPNCIQRVLHQRGVPCSSLTCPQCGSRMTRR